MKFLGYRKCSTCRQAHQYLKNGGMDVEFHDLVEAPPSAADLTEYVEQSGEPIFAFVNSKGTKFRELNLKDQRLTDDEWLRLLSTDGKLLKRPILVTDEQIVLGFDKSAYDAVIARHRTL